MLTKDDLQQIRQIVREEVTLQTSPLQDGLKQVRGEISEVRGDISEIREDISEIREELSEVREEVKTLDMKVEVLNAKFDEKIERVYSDMSDGFERVINTIDELHGPLKVRVKTLEDHVGISQ